MFRILVTQIKYDKWYDNIYKYLVTKKLFIYFLLLKNFMFVFSFFLGYYYYYYYVIKTKPVIYTYSRTVDDAMQ